MDGQPSAQDHKDQRTGMIVFGSLGVLAGCLCGLFCLFYLAMAAGLLGSAARPPFAAFVQVMGFYGGAGVAFIWLGIGSIACLRWARALILAMAWLWLVSGAMGLAVLFAMHGNFDQAMAQAFKDAGGGPPPGVVLAIKLVTLSVLTVIYVIIPAALLLFYGRQSVRLTCVARDPIPRWTDPVPMPALVTAVMLALFSAGLIVSAITPAWPCFKWLLRGAPAHAAALAQATLFALAAWGAFRLRPWAWWLGLIMPLLMTLSFAVFMRKVGVASYIDAFVLDPQQRKAIEGSPFMEPGKLDWLMVTYPVLFTGFMLWVKRHFSGAPHRTDDPGSSPGL
ncbi:MAG TPA: hypothetical protein PLU30_09095 [Verrucomicrobiae bacterium]|nr:hypothetical protein [Verrucomicrobiae bacterium]